MNIEPFLAEANAMRLNGEFLKAAILRFPKIYPNTHVLKRRKGGGFEM